MIYFLNSGFGENKSGIEHAEIKRIHLFDYHHQPCTLVTREWDRSLHSITAKAGISDDQLLNLYDFYQGTRHVDSVHVGYKDVDLGISDVTYHRDENNQRYLAYRTDGRLIARINYDPESSRQKCLMVNSTFTRSLSMTNAAFNQRLIGTHRTTMLKGLNG